MAGILASLFLSQQVDVNGQPLVGGKLSIFTAGTTTPVQVYATSALATTVSNPLTLDGHGRVPVFWLADGTYKARLTDQYGVVQFEDDGIPATGVSSGESGGGTTVDSASLWQTGDIKPRYGIGVHSGWVRLNGRTIGPAGSGGTERQDDDTRPLYEFLWNADANLVVLGGRGASASADWTLGKPITLPSGEGRDLRGLDDMGAGARGRITTATTPTPTALGTVGGAERVTLTTLEIPVHTHVPAFTAPRYDKTTAHAFITQGGGASVDVFTAASGYTETLTTGGAVTIGDAGGGASHNNMPPFLLLTFYIKL